MTRFVVLAAPRTGSNWLCSLLDSHPDILSHHEIFNPDGIHTALSARHLDLGFGDVAERDREPLAVLARVWDRSLGHRAVGFKLNRGQNDLVLRHVLDDVNIKKVVIRRANRVRTFVSERLAEASGEWESYHGRPIGLQQRALRVDPDDLRRHVRLNARYYEGIEAMLSGSGQTALNLWYEHLDRAETHREMLEFLDVTPDVHLRSGTRKQNAAPLDKLIGNLGALRLALRGSDLERDLWAEDAPAGTSEVAR